MMKIRLLLLSSILICHTLWAAPNSNDINNALLNGDNKELLSITADVLTHSQSVDSLTLLLASVAAMSVKKYEDAAFLYYIATMRYFYDRHIYPPVKQGGNGPGALFSAMSSNIPFQFNLQLASNPEAIRRIAIKLQKWKPDKSKHYDPGWEYGASTKPPLNINKSINATVKYLNKVAIMLDNPHYQSLLQKLKRYFIKPDDTDSLDFQKLSKEGVKFEKNWGTNFIFHQY